jgi:hypothetical protein
MSAIFLLPGLLSIYLLIRGRIETVFLCVYLPALLLLPDGYAFRLPHLPPISAAQAALIPLGAVALYRLARKGLPSLMDILVGLFVVSIAASEVLRERVTNDGIQAAIISFVSIFLAYAVGRTMIEPGLRLATIRRIVILILFLGPIGLYEWRFGQNLYGVIGQRIFQLASVHVEVHIRSGHGRVAASFNDCELAGIAFGITAALNAWLVYMRKCGSNIDLGMPLNWLEKYHIPGLLLLLYVFLTQSRGPILAVAVGYLILQIPRFKNKRVAFVVAVALIAAASIGAFQYYFHYTNISDLGAIASEQQGSALYRRQMNELYKPLVSQGGLLGWGMLSRPVLPGMFSIDNEYLLVHLAYGSAGYILFILIAAESLRGLIAHAWTIRQRNDHAFAIALLGAMTIFWISITTVYMGEQIPQLVFLLIGWSKSLSPGNWAPSLETVETGHPSKFRFSKILN